MIIEELREFDKTDKEILEILYLAKKKIEGTK